MHKNSKYCPSHKDQQYIYIYLFNLLHNKQASKAINQATVDHDAAAVVNLWGLMKKPLL
jgi:hypothetical protein